VVSAVNRAPSVNAGRPPLESSQMALARRRGGTTACPGPSRSPDGGERPGLSPSRSRRDHHGPLRRPGCHVLRLLPATGVSMADETTVSWRLHEMLTSWSGWSTRFASPSIRVVIRRIRGRSGGDDGGMPPPVPPHRVEDRDTDGSSIPGPTPFSAAAGDRSEAWGSAVVDGGERSISFAGNLVTRSTVASCRQPTRPTTTAAPRHLAGARPRRKGGR
jgi:hypothetical protein